MAPMGPRDSLVASPTPGFRNTQRPATASVRPYGPAHGVTSKAVEQLIDKPLCQHPSDPLNPLTSGPFGPTKRAGNLNLEPWRCHEII